MRLIDADEVIKAVNELMIVDKTVMSFVLMNAATVDAVPVRHGRWEHHWDDHDDWLQCSECGYGDEGEVGMNQGTNFCPNCGARMDGKGNGNETD